MDLDYISYEGSFTSGSDDHSPYRITTKALDSRLVKAIVLMEENLQEQLCFDDIAAECKLTRRHLERLFAKHLNTSPARYYMKLRLHKAKALIRHTRLPAKQIAYRTGFKSTPHFSKSYRDFFNHTPKEERASKKEHAPNHFSNLHSQASLEGHLS